MHTAQGTPGNVSDVVKGNSLPHGQETDVFGDAGYQNTQKRPDASKGASVGKWQCAQASAKNWTKKTNPIDALRSSRGKRSKPASGPW